VEVRLHERLQEPLNHRLSNAVSDRRNPEWPSPAVSLRYVYPSHRRRIVTARRHSVPELVEVVRKISLKVRNRLPVDACRTLVDAVDGSSTGTSVPWMWVLLRLPRIAMQMITTIGLDIAKSVFQVHRVDARGQVVIRRQLKRRQVLCAFQEIVSTDFRRS
jgi:hypothetical protein